eukprot:g27832.t1
MQKRDELREYLRGEASYMMYALLFKVNHIETKPAVVSMVSEVVFFVFAQTSHKFESRFAHRRSWFLSWSAKIAPQMCDASAELLKQSFSQLAMAMTIQMEDLGDARHWLNTLELGDCSQREEANLVSAVGIVRYLSAQGGKEACACLDGGVLEGLIKLARACGADPDGRYNGLLQVTLELVESLFSNPVVGPYLIQKRGQRAWEDMLAGLDKLHKDLRAMPAVRNCSACGNFRGPFKDCVCGTATYCGRDCQKQHWKTHKAACKQAIAKKASADPAGTEKEKEKENEAPVSASQSNKEAEIDSDYVLVSAEEAAIENTTTEQASTSNPPTDSPSSAAPPDTTADKQIDTKALDDVLREISTGDGGSDRASSTVALAGATTKSSTEAHKSQGNNKRKKKKKKKKLCTPRSDRLG